MLQNMISLDDGSIVCLFSFCIFTMDMFFSKDENKKGEIFFFFDALFLRGFVIERRFSVCHYLIMSASEVMAT